jgi:MEMO1 family protein
MRRWLVAGALFLALALASPASGPSPAEERPPAVAGQFYPQSPEKLRAGLAALLRDALPARAGPPVAIVVPHAGYVYSGQIAADGFSQARGGRYDVIVILGANHTSAGFRGIGVSPASRFRTPLGAAPVDRDLARELLAACPDCVMDEAVHAREHSLEVQVPFVQLLFPAARILPIVVASDDLALLRRFGTALAKVLTAHAALIVASSDLSHYPRAEDAERVDDRTLQAIAGLDPEALRSSLRSSLAGGAPGLETGACGEAPILAAQIAARALGAKRGVFVSYANSGQTLLGDPGRVVGYGAVAFVADEKTPQTPPQPAGTSSVGVDRRLLAFARAAIERLLATETLPLPRGFGAESEARREGVFVTLRKHGQLRGCIGRIVPDAPLPRLVGAMALQSAFGDPRFSPLKEEELREVEVELSFLTPMRRIARPDVVVAGRHGVLLEKAGHSAVFLPQVATEQGWDRTALLDNLCRKGDLPVGCWREGATLSVFEARIVSE